MFFVSVRKRPKNSRAVFRKASDHKSQLYSPKQKLNTSIFQLIRIQSFFSVSIGKQEIGAANYTTVGN